MTQKKRDKCREDIIEHLKNEFGNISEEFSDREEFLSHMGASHPDEVQTTAKLQKLLAKTDCAYNTIIQSGQHFKIAEQLEGVEYLNQKGKFKIAMIDFIESECGGWRDD